MGSTAGPAPGGGERASGRDDDGAGAKPEVAVAASRLATVVMCVSDLDSSVGFYRELLGMKVTLVNDVAALLVSPDMFQLYLRSIGPRADLPVGGLGVQYVIWTTPTQEDLRRCERFLKDAGSHVNTQTGDGFTLVEGRDPSSVPVLLTYPGPDDAVRHQIMSRIYT